MVGTTLNSRYLIESELGRGGMGVVYRARDLSLNRAVAVKVLPPEFILDEQFLRRFQNEVLNVARLDHPNIVQIYDVGQEGNTQYYVMQFVEGSDLHTEILRRGRFSLDETLTILRLVATALDYAHEQGIVHRDIKPDNILLDRNGSPRVVDFGIARTVEGTHMTGGIIGTPEYMSPEQARGEALDGHADQYALAIVAYEMLTGTTPFRSDTAQAWALVNAHITAPPPDPRQWLGDIPEHVVESLMQALAKVPGYRFASCAQFVAALAGQVQPVMPPMPSTSGATLYQPVPQTPASLPPVPRSNAGIQGFLGAIVGILLLGGGWLLIGQRIIGSNKHSFGQPAQHGYSTPAPTPHPITVEHAAHDYGGEAQPDAGTSSTNTSHEGPRWSWTSQRLVDQSDLAGMSKTDLELMRNEIYARYGWLFMRQDLQEYFDAQTWYHRGGSASQRDAINRRIAAKMSALEKKNAAIILNQEKSKGGE